MKKVPIELQIEAVSGLLARTRRYLTLREVEAAEGAIRFLEWCRDNSEILHMASLLHKDARVQGVLAITKGVTVDSIRRVREDLPDVGN